MERTIETDWSRTTDGKTCSSTRDSGSCASRRLTYISGRTLLWLRSAALLLECHPTADERAAATSPGIFDSAASAHAAGQARVLRRFERLELVAIPSRHPAADRAPDRRADRRCTRCTWGSRQPADCTERHADRRKSFPDARRRGGGLRRTFHRRGHPLRGDAPLRLAVRQIGRCLAAFWFEKDRS